MVSERGGGTPAIVLKRSRRQFMFLAKGLSATLYKNRFTPLSSLTRSSSGGSVVTRNVAVVPLSGGLFSFFASHSAIEPVTAPNAKELITWSNGGCTDDLIAPHIQENFRGLYTGPPLLSGTLSGVF